MKETADRNDKQEKANADSTIVASRRRVAHQIDGENHQHHRQRVGNTSEQQAKRDNVETHGSRVFGKEPGENSTS